MDRWGSMQALEREKVVRKYKGRSMMILWDAWFCLFLNAKLYSSQIFECSFCFYVIVKWYIDMIKKKGFFNLFDRYKYLFIQHKHPKQWVATLFYPFPSFFQHLYRVNRYETFFFFFWLKSIFIFTYLFSQQLEDLYFA